VRDRLLRPNLNQSATKAERGLDQVWLVLFALFAIWIAHRLGAFDLFRTVVTEDGRRVRLPNTFATVDHPFHVVRAETLRRALAGGELLRWIGHHQGGYPVEFYPLGVAWLEVGTWAVFFGQLPMAAIHKLVIILIFLAPGVPFALMARRDGWPLGVGLVALAAHVAVPGGEWQGGYTELVEWGLVTNIAASVALLMTLALLTIYLSDGHRLAAAGAAVSAAFAVSTNPRSLVALAVVGAGVWIAAWSGGPVTKDRILALTRRLALVGGLTALLAAPELLSLLRFEHLYYFVRYSGYENQGEYLRASIEAVSLPVLLLGVGGIAVGLLLPSRPATRSAAVTLVLYVLVTAVLSSGPRDEGVFEQLETTRLMPFQRLLTVYLAATALYVAVHWVTSGMRRQRLVADLLLVAAGGALLFAFVVPNRFLEAEDRGLYPVQSAASPDLADLNEAVDVADAEAPAGTALLVIGASISWDSWHTQLWAPLRADRAFFYDDWLWYWQTRHWGPYDPLTQHNYPEPWSILNREYFEHHGIGALVVTGPSRSVAATSPDLSLVRQGLYDVYVVREPTAIVTISGTNATAIDVENQRLHASGTSNGGEALIRRNWHPRWRATVNGQSIPITQTADGYMMVPIPEGDVEIQLVYVVDWLDWLARGAVIVGVVAAIVLFMFRRDQTQGSMGTSITDGRSRAKASETASAKASGDVARTPGTP
jgi:hypothetical protein